MGLNLQRHPTFAGITILAAVSGLLLALVGCGGAAGTSQDAETPNGFGATPSTAQRSAAAPTEASKGSLAAPSPRGVTGSGVDASTVPADQKLIVRSKTMRVEVTAVTSAIDKIRALASRDGADITELQVATSTDEPIYRELAPGEVSSTQSDAALQAFVTVRVPAAKYQSFIDDAVKLGRLLFQAENTEDVTQQHVDLKARLDNLRAEEVRLRQFFVSAKNVTEMLQIEQELSRVRGDIESLSAQVAYLERQAAMATVTIELTEPAPIIRPAGTNWGTGEALTTGIRAFVGTINGLIVIILAMAPILILLLLALLVGRVVWKQSRRRRAVRQAAVAAERSDSSAAR